MKVAAVSPLFLQEVPESVDVEETQAVAADLNELRVVGTEAGSQAGLAEGDTLADQTLLEEETREGIKRLSQLIRKRKNQNQAARDQILSLEGRKIRAIEKYQNVQAARDSTDQLGVLINKSY